MTHFTSFSQNEVSATINYKIFNNNCNGSSLEAYPCFPPVTQIANHVLLNGNCRRLIRRADLSFQNFIKLSTVLSCIICSYISHNVKSTLPSMRMSHPFEYYDFLMALLLDIDEVTKVGITWCETMIRRRTGQPSDSKSLQKG